MLKQVRKGHLGLEILRIEFFRRHIDLQNNLVKGAKVVPESRFSNEKLLCEEFEGGGPKGDVRGG